MRFHVDELEGLEIEDAIVSEVAAELDDDLVAAILALLFGDPHAIAARDRALVHVERMRRSLPPLPPVLIC
jgi:hypothetical protein